MLKTFRKLLKYTVDFCVRVKIAVIFIILNFKRLKERATDCTYNKQFVLY